MIIIPLNNSRDRDYSFEKYKLDSCRSGEIFEENNMNGSFIHTIGITRAKAKIGMMNLAYNICCRTQLRIVVAMTSSGCR